MTVYKDKYYFFPLNYIQGKQSAEEWSSAEITDTDCHPHLNISIFQTLKVTLSGVDEAQCCLNPAHTTMKKKNPLCTGSALQSFRRGAHPWSFLFCFFLCLSSHFMLSEGMRVTDLLSSHESLVASQATSF